jgi:L-iditol 2-dehydrogenase
MRAVRLHGRRDLRLHDEEPPEPRAGEELVGVTSVGICGSDLHWYEEGSVGDARLEAPLVLGHEAAGVILAGERAGRRVAIDPAIPCGHCDPCLRGRPHVCEDLAFAGSIGQDGALREVMAWPSASLVEVPDELDPIAALMLEPLGVAIHAFGLARPSVGDAVGVFGCGPIGLLLVQLARLSGARAIVATDRLPHRLEAAQACGATDVALVDAGRERTLLGRVAPGGLDATFEAVGDDDALETALHLARPASRVVLVGIPGGDRTTFPAALARRKGLSLLVSRRMNQAYPRAIELVRTGRIDVRSLVTHRFPLARSAEAFESASSRIGLKVVVDVG